MAVCQNLVPLVNIKIAGKWMFIPLKMVLIGIDPYPYVVKLVMAFLISEGSSNVGFTHFHNHPIDQPLGGVMIDIPVMGGLTLW